MLEWTERPIDQVSFDEGTEKSIDVPRDNPIRRMICEFFFYHTTGGSAPTYINDDFLNLIQSVKLQMDGNENKFAIGGRQWYYLEKDDKQTAPYKDTPTSSTTTAETVRVCLVWDFASDPLDRQDITALLPANRLSSLKLKILWGTVSTHVTSANPSTMTDASSGVNVEIREVSGTVNTPNGEKDIGEIAFADIRVDAKVIAIPPSKTSYDTSTLKENVTPAPSNIMKNLFIVLDNGVRSNSLITGFKVQKEKGGSKPLLTRTWMNAYLERKTESRLESLATGVLALDYVDIFGSGLINRGNEGDVRYRFLTSSGAVEAQDTLEIVSRYISLEAV